MTLGKVKVIVLGLAQPKPDQDIPIDVDEKNFVFYQDFLKSDGHIQPPSLQNGPLKDEEVFIIFWSSGTTGNPKGKNIIRGVGGIQALYESYIFEQIHFYCKPILIELAAYFFEITKVKAIWHLSGK